MVWLLGRPFEDYIPAAHVRGRRELHALEDVECAVDGAHVDERVDLADLVEDLGRAHMAAGVPKGTDDHQALGSHFVAGLAEELGGLVLTTHPFSLHANKSATNRSRT